MTIKNIFRLVIGGIISLFLAIFGFQRKKISKQKEEILEKEEEVKEAEKKATQAHKTVEVIKCAVKVENAIQEQEDTNATKIQEASEDELVEVGNHLIDDFNKSGKL